jgi:hypothetical protein
MNIPFHFYTQLHLVKLTGLKAKNQFELLEGIKKVPASSIYYHTHRFLQQHHYLSPEPPNDFAYWLTNILGLKELGESFACVNTVRFENMEELRTEFSKILTEYISKGNYIVNYPDGHEFHFMSCVTFVLPTPYVAHNIKEFLELLEKISINSLYFHIFEARMRLQRDVNDFSAWFRARGDIELANELLRLDPYTITLEGLRQKIINLVWRYAQY